MGAVKDMRSSILLVALRAIYWLEINGSSHFYNSLGKKRPWSTIFRVRINIVEAHQLFSKTLKKKSEIITRERETGKYTMSLQLESIKRLGTKAKRVFPAKIL